MFCLFLETAGSVDEAILKCLIVILKKSPIWIIIPKCVHLNCWENCAQIHQRDILEIQKSEEVLIEP
jgi:hypothetical protein